MLADRIPGASLQIEPGALHCPHLDSPAARQRILAFLTP